jgi:hypothetical protein
MGRWLWVLVSGVVLSTTGPAAIGDDNVILNPGTLSGSVSIAGRQVTSITVDAIDTVKLYSATRTISVPDGADSIDYVLTVEGGRDYYVVARARVSAADYIYALFPVTGPVTVPVGGDVPLDLSMNPAIISGTISTGSNMNTIESYSIYAYVTVPEFGSSYSSYASASNLNTPGDTGRDYTLLMAPGVEYYLQAYIYIDGMQYYFYDSGVTAPAAGVTSDRDYTIDVTAARVSGTALLLGLDVTSASVYGTASSPSRNSTFWIPDLSTGLYTLDVDAGAWRLSPYFYFRLPGDLSGLTGYLRVPYSTAMNINAGDQLTGVDFIVNPGFIPGTLNLWGANTNFMSAYVEAYASGSGYALSYVAPGTGEFLMVCSPGDWRTGYYQYLYFDYPDDPDSALYSFVYQSNSSTDVQTVLAGQTTPSLDLTFGTITVRRYFYVAGGGTLSRPYIRAIRHEAPQSLAYGYGSLSPTTEGQAMVTLLLPGTYTIEAFAYVDGSNTEFGSVDVTVDEGDVVVIGGSDRPTVQLTNPTNEETVCGKKVTVEGTITDDYGIASITINGEDVAFDPSEDPVHFSHEVILNLGENVITIVVSDTDQTEPVVLTLTVFSEDCGNPCPVVTLTSPVDGQSVNSNTIVVEGTAWDDVGIASITINGEDVPFEHIGDPEEEGDTVWFSRQIGLDCGENVITIVVSDLDQTEPTVTEVTVNNTACAIQVPIDIYPNRLPNMVYLSTDYTMYVALLGAEGFAVTDVDSSTVRFGRSGTEASPVREPKIRDLNGDGFDDALYGFLTFDCGFELGDNTGTLTGQTTGGTPIAGNDSVSVLP